MAHIPTFLYIQWGEMSKPLSVIIFLSPQVFRPQNPWTMAIMNVLAELHQEHDLKVVIS